jgi:predicted DNA-binding WGR domain protein
MVKEWWGRYEYTDEKSNKFWAIEPLMDGMARVSWGRIGTRGQYQEVTRDEALDRARKKVAKGYKRVESIPEQASDEVKEAKKRVKEKRAERKAKGEIWDDLAKAEGE